MLAAEHRGSYALGMSRLRFTGLTRRLSLLTAALTLTFMHTAAWAQQSVAAPQPSLQKSPPVWLGLLVIFLLLVAVVMVSLMPSRRGHQD